MKTKLLDDARTETGKMNPECGAGVCPVTSRTGRPASRRSCRACKSRLLYWKKNKETTMKEISYIVSGRVFNRIKHKRSNPPDYVPFVASNLPIGPLPPRCSRFILTLLDGDIDAINKNLANKAAHIVPEIRILRNKAGDIVKIYLGLIKYSGSLATFIRRHNLKSPHRKT